MTKDKKPTHTRDIKTLQVMIYNNNSNKGNKRSTIYLLDDYAIELIEDVKVFNLRAKVNRARPSLCLYRRVKLEIAPSFVVCE